jgi:hypothetical protein
LTKVSQVPAGTTFGIRVAAANDFAPNGGGVRHILFVSTVRKIYLPLAKFHVRFRFFRSNLDSEILFTGVTVNEKIVIIIYSGNFCRRAGGRLFVGAEFVEKL